MIDITKLKDADIGRQVEYSPRKNHLEKGVIKSWNEKWIFVVYHCDDKWAKFQDYTVAMVSNKVFIQEITHPPAGANYNTGE